MSLPPRWSPRLLLLTAALAPVWLGCGCSQYRPPAITIGPAAVVERTDEAIALGVELDLTNPNDEPLELREFNYAVSIQGKTVYTGRRAAEATLSAKGTKRLTLPVVVPVAQVPATAPDGGIPWSISGNLLYVTPGEIAELLLDTGVRKPKVSFSGKGRSAEH